MSGLITGQRPSLTPAQIVSGIPAIALALRAFGVYDMTEDQQDALVIVGLWALTLIIGDAGLRGFRNLADGKVKAAALAQPGPAVVPVERDLPSDEEEFFNVPPDSSNTPVQPSQVEDDGSGDLEPRG